MQENPEKVQAIAIGEKDFFSSSRASLWPAAKTVKFRQLPSEKKRFFSSSRASLLPTAKTVKLLGVELDYQLNF